MRLCPVGHPCDKECSETCGDCAFPIGNIVIPLCGHVVPKTSWSASLSIPAQITDSMLICLGYLSSHLARHPEQIVCEAIVKRKLPTCDHEAEMPCSQDPSTVLCRHPCNSASDCGKHRCKARCHECQALSKRAQNIGGIVNRHKAHSCDRDLLCGHRCADLCTSDHECSGRCNSPCRQTCSHQTCNLGCSAPCVPCKEKCEWTCEHHACPLPCGSVRRQLKGR